MEKKELYMTLPRDLYRAVSRSAKANERTVSQEIRYALRKYLRERGERI